jgi:hypothetical protein
MPKFEVTFYQTTRHTKVVEADSEEEAKEALEGIDVYALDEDPDFYNLSLMAAELIEEEEYEEEEYEDE